MSENIAEVLDLVKEAQSPNKFNLSEVIKGRGYPEDKVEVYLDVESAYKLDKLNDKLILLTTEEETAPVEAEAKELADKILESKLTFHMRGIPQSVVEAIERKSKVNKSGQDDEVVMEYFSRIIAASIIKVEDAQGNIDDHQFTHEEVSELRGSFPSESWTALLSAVQKLTLASGYFQGLTDAGFLPKS